MNPIIDVLTRLADAGVEFVVCGGLACILHGVSRTTQDLDLYVALEEENLGRLIDVAESMGLRPRVPEPIEALADADRRRDWVEHKRAVVYTLQDSKGIVQLDVFLRYPIAWSDLLRDAESMDMNGRRIRVSSIAHLIAAKEAVVPPRKADLRDIVDLRELLDEQA